MLKKLFIHIPKNGGMTIRHKQSLTYKKVIHLTRGCLKSKEYLNGMLDKMKEIGRKGSCPSQHARWRDLKQSIKEKYQAFAIVRNPWSRVVSRYTFGVSHGQYKKTFEEFLESRHHWQGSERDYTWHLAIHGWFPAYDYVTDEDGKMKCDIMRFEKIDEDVSQYFNFAKGTVLDIRNVSNGTKAKDRKSILARKSYKDFYNKNTIQIIADWYKKDIETWGFDFDTGATKNYWNNND